MSRRFVRAPRARRAAAPAAARFQPRRQGPPQHRPMGAMLQLRAAEWVAAPAASGMPGRAGLPKWLKAGVERLSGLAMDDVRVHRDSAQPARLGALAYTKGSDIHLGPGEERHLPHEAWHVVQQKQGRVKATTQMRGVALGADAGLEAEADRMGAAAAGAALTPPAGLANRAASSAVVQAKVKDGDTWLKETDTVSPTLRTFIADGNSYLLRDDFHGKLMAEPVHLMDMSSRFLLGEEHGPAATAKWNADTKFWSKVGKMFESTKALPRGDRAAVGMAGETDLQDQALESRHAFTLVMVLDAIDQINQLGASWVSGLWTDPQHKAFISQMFAGAKDALHSADFGLADYNAFIGAYEKKKKRSLARSRKIYRFAVSFRDSYHGQIGKLKALLVSAREAVDKYDPAKKDDPARKDEIAALSTTVSDSLKAIAVDHQFLRPMASRLIGISGITDPKELKTLNTLLAPTDVGQGSEMLEAADPARERGMADNITAAAAPLLVKVGNDHLGDLKALVGASAVLVPKDDSLETKTRRP